MAINANSEMRLSKRERELKRERERVKEKNREVEKENNLEKEFKEENLNSFDAEKSFCSFVILSIAFINTTAYHLGCYEPCVLQLKRAS